jgi:S1-C subfamily serine protease
VTVWTSARDGVRYALGDDDARRGAINDGYRVARGWRDRDRWPATQEAAGERTEGGRRFDLTAITPEGGRPFTLWVDHATHLIDRVVEQQGEGVSVTRFADYRAVGALSLPFTIRRGDGDTAHDDVETVTRVEINPEIPDDRFSLPPLPARPAGVGTTPVMIPFRLENDQVLIDVLLNGKGPFEAFFDSGGSLIIPPRVVAELGLTAAGASRTSGGGEGYVISGSGRIATVSIGGALVRDTVFDSFTWDDENPEQLLVGLEILQRYVVRIDVDTMVMTLTPPDAFRASDRGVALPFVFQDNQPLIEGSIEGIAARFAVDTGSNTSLQLIAPFAGRYRLVERYHATLPYGGSAIGATRGVMARAGVVSMNGPDGRPAVSVHRPVTWISTQTGGFDAHRYVSAILGMGILRQFNVTFDYARQRMFLEPSHRYGEPDVFNRTGMALERKGTGWTIASIVPGGPADQAKLRAGDVVLTINGASNEALDRAALKRLTTGPVGARLAIEVAGAGGKRVASLELRDVL